MNNKKLFIYGTSLDFSSRVIFIITGFVLNVVFARYFGVEIYGDLAIILSLLTLLNVFLTNGVPNTLSKYMAAVDVKQTDLFYKTIIIQLMVTVIISFIFLICVDPLCRYSNILYLKRYLFMLLVLLPLNALFYLSIGVLNGLRDFKSQAIVNIIYPVLRLLSILFLIFGFKMGITGVILGTAIAYLPSIYFAFSKFKFTKRGQIINVKEIISFSFKIMGLFLLVTIFLNVDLIVIRSLAESKKDVGIYGAMMTIGKIAYFILYSFSTIIFPIISKMKSEDNNTEIPNLLNKVFNIFFGVSALIIITILFYSSDILRILYGNEFVKGYKLLPPYTLGIIGLSTTSLIANILFVIQKNKIFLYLIFIAPVIEIVGIYHYYDKMGLLSAAIMFAITSGLMSVSLILLLKKQMSNSISHSNLVFISISIGSAVFLKNNIMNMITSNLLREFSGLIFLLIFSSLWLHLYRKDIFSNKKQMSIF